MIITITLAPTVAKSELHRSDQELASKYRVETNKDVKKELVANVALDVFHANIPVKRLEDFNFIVLDEDGTEIEEAEYTQEGSLLDMGIFLGE